MLDSPTEAGRRTATTNGKPVSDAEAETGGTRRGTLAKNGQETCGGTLWTRAIQKEGDLGRRLSCVLSIPEGSCLFFEKQGFCCEKPRGGDGTGTVMGTESTYQVTCGDHVYYLPSFYPHSDNTIIDLTKS